MSEWLVTLIVFACVVSAGPLGMLVRSFLPDHHLEERSKDVVRLGMGLVATMAALVLGLLIASAKGTYDNQNQSLEQISANLVVLDITLAQYGPETEPVRGLLRQHVATAIGQLWPQDLSQASSIAPESTAKARSILGEIQALAPQNDMQRDLKSQATQLAFQLGQARWLMVARQEGNSTPAVFLVVLIFWLAALFASFGLFAPRNATVIATLFVCALSVSGAIFLILEMADPFRGLIQVPSAPLREAYAHLGE